MNHVLNHQTSSYGIKECIVAFTALSVLAAALAPALAQSRDNSDRARCLSNARQIALACLNYESARRYYPLASTTLVTSKPASFGDADAAGFSWLVTTLPFLGQEPATRYYDRLAQTSNSFRNAPFDPAVTSPGNIENLPTRDLVIETFLCPSFVATLNAPAADATNPVTMTKLPAISNYHALAASHFFNAQGIGRMVPPEQLVAGTDGRAAPSTPYEGNGALPFPGALGGQVVQRGLRLSQITDGLSRTLLFVETVEPEFAAWLDGQVTWCISAWPGTPNPPALLPQADPSDAPLLGWNADQLPTNWTSLGKRWSPDANRPTPPYLSANRWSGGKDRTWGPSSYHGNRVMHAFGDGHAEMLSLDIDKNAYLHLATRAGRETIPDGAIK